MFFSKIAVFLLFLTVTVMSFAAEQETQLDPLQKRASSGDVAAQLEIGKEYFKGVKRPLNRALALYYFNLAAKAGSPEGMFNLGMCYEYGVEYETDHLSAYHWYSKADKFLPALFKKAVYLEKGIPSSKKKRSYRRGIPADPALARDILNELIKQQYPPALTHQARKYLQNTSSSDREFREAFQLLSIAAKKGDISAYRLLADCYEWGMGCEKNEKNAFELMQNAAALGDSGAAAKLGAYYEHGIGTAPDLQKSVEFYKKSADLGEPIGMVQMAKHYSSGFVIPADLAKALELCQQAASLNERSAFTLLGIFYQQGAGVAADSKKAFSLFLKSAAMGDPEAQYHLAMAFKNGNGTPKDESGAIYWMKKAASMHYAPAIEILNQWNQKK